LEYISRPRDDGDVAPNLLDALPLSDRELGNLPTGLLDHHALHAIDPLSGAVRVPVTVLHPHRQHLSKAGYPIAMHALAGVRFGMSPAGLAQLECHREP
jgi:hypothetical protein